jgi:hypothetical protein
MINKTADRLISRRTEYAWPAHSPDLRPLDYWFWGEMDRLIHLRKPNDIPVLKKIIDEAANQMSEEKVRRAVSNFHRRVHLCTQNNGAHFEAEM